MSYIPYRVYLSDGQKNKLKSCYKNKKSCSLRLELNNPNQTVNLTQTQINKIENNKRLKKGSDIELSISQLHQNGGFLPFLAPLIPIAAKAIAAGALGALGAKAINKITGKGVKLPGKQKNFGQGVKLPGKIFF